MECINFIQSIFFLFFCLSFFLLEVSEVLDYWIRPLSKLMPVNLSQYRRVVGACNSWFIHIKRHNTFMNAFSQINVKQTIDNEIFDVFTSFLLFLLISSSWSFVKGLRISTTFISLLVFRISYICILLAFIHQIRLYLIMFNRSEDSGKVLDPSLILVKHFLFVTGI